MAKVKLTKNELKRQREALARFTRYLPTLQLKKQQLRMEINKVNHKIEGVKKAVFDFEKEVDEWVDLFGEDVDMERLIKVKTIANEKGNVAGREIPVYKGVDFIEEKYDLYKVPLWVDAGIKALKKILEFKGELLVLEKQRDILNEELRITAQRVNLFEKVKIPQAEESIRVIRIFLGDLFTVDVVRGKIAKAKLAKNQNN
ncbi:MAG: V-type ATP synthase subunit D [Candidatus Omnitrophota bacterium]